MIVLRETPPHVDFGSTRMCLDSLIPSLIRRFCCYAEVVASSWLDMGGPLFQVRQVRLDWSQQDMCRPAPSLLAFGLILEKVAVVRYVGSTQLFQRHSLEYS